MKVKVEILKVIEDKDLQEALWKIYEKAFTPDKKKYPHNQMNYTHESFLNAMTDEREVKIVLTDDSKPLGFLIVIDYRYPENSPWTNFQAFTRKGGSEKFMYMNTVAINSEYQKKGLALLLFDKFVDWATKKGIVLAGFDTPREKGFLVEIAKNYYSKKGVNIELIGAQNYYLLKKVERQK